MKVVTAIAVLAVALLAFGWWRNVQTSATQLETAQKETLSISNKLVETEQKLAIQEQFRTVHDRQLREQEEATASVSNALTRARAETAKSREEIAALQARIQTEVARVAELNGQRAALAQVEVRQRAEIKRLEQRIAEGEASLEVAEARRVDLRNELEMIKVERAGLIEQLNNPAKLRRRADALSGWPPLKADSGERLLLEPDGSVSVVPLSPPAELR